MKIPGQQRKAISPIVATVLIVASTLIAFAAVAGYVFGVLGGGGSTANVTLSNVVLHAGATAGSISLLNTGTANTQVAAAAAITINYGGASCTYATSGGPTTVTAGAAAASVTVPAPALGVYCTGTTATAGESYTITVPLTNGATPSFTSSFVS